MVCWLFYTYIIHAAYDCNLRAYLMSTDFEAQVDSSKDLVEQGRKMYFYKAWDECSHYESLPDELYEYEKAYAKQAYDNDQTVELVPEKHGWFLPMQFEKDMIEKGHVILVGGEHQFKMELRRYLEVYGEQPFRLSKSPLRAYDSYCGITIKKYSTLKDFLEPTILNLRSGGIIDQMRRSYYYFWVPDPKEDILKPIDFDHIVYCVALLGLGLTLSTVAFIIEVVHFCSHK